MTNPWADLPIDSPYVLPIDELAIATFDRTANDTHRIHPEIIPEPFLGNPLAPVVLLNLNPGFVESDQVVHFDSSFNAAARANLNHGASGYPFYLLDPRLPLSPGREWWMKKLRTLIAATSLEIVASCVFVLEIHGYHSRRFSPRLHLPSQEYTRALLLRAIERRAQIVVMRGLRFWRSLVPEVDTAEPRVVRNVQNPTISPGNLDRFDALVRVLTP